MFGFKLKLQKNFNHRESISNILAIFKFGIQIHYLKIKSLFRPPFDLI